MASAFWLLLAGAGIADGKASVLQTKSYSIKQNGNYAFTPDAGYDGFSSINVSVAVEAKLQEKSITPTKQEQTVTPDTGFEGLSKIVVGAIPASYIDTSGANATAPDILAPKTAYVNGELVTGTMQEYDGSVTNGTEGMKPQLNTPTITVSGRQLTITNPSTNGNFTEGYKIFVDGVEKSEQTANTLDLYSYFDEDGTYQLSVAAAAAQFADSNQSSQATYQKRTPTSGVVWLKNAESLERGRCRLAAASVGNYALFGGGYTGIAGSNIVDAYDNTLTKTMPSHLHAPTQQLAATNVGNYALFGGGTYANVDAYDSSLTRIVAENLSEHRTQLAATKVGNYAFFGGGYASTEKDTVEVYDENLTKSIATPLSFATYMLAATPVGDHALFGGGQVGSSTTDVVYAYDTELTKTTIASLSQPRRQLSATTVGDYAVFGSGYYGKPTVDAYDSSLTKTTVPEQFVEAVHDYGATTIGKYALFGGGLYNERSAYVFAYNDLLTRSLPTGLAVARFELAATTVGNYALFGGGSPEGRAYSDTVDVYTVKE